MYRTVNGSRPVHEQGTDAYLFPSLPVGLSQEQRAETIEKSGFRLSFGSRAAGPPKFSALFDTSQEMVSNATDPGDRAEVEAEQIREQAYAKGFVEGQKAGEEGQKVKLKEAFKALHAVMVELDALKNRLYHDAEREGVELGLMIARRIVCREVSVDPEMIFRVLQEALKKVDDQKEIHVKVHPTDLQAIKDAGLDVSQLSKGNGHVVFEPGDGICRGGCVVETDFGFVDARIESQLRTVEESLRHALQDAKPAQ